MIKSDRIIIILAVIILLLMLCLGYIILRNQRTLKYFSEELANILDDMISEKEVAFSICQEDLMGKLQIKLKRLYGILNDNTRKAEAEKREMQALISDISHQVKTPISNVKMYYEILSGRELSKEKKKEFLELSIAQIEKLDFLLQSMIKMSRLESGIIELYPEVGVIYDTLANALGEILLKSEEKQLSFSIQCEEGITAVYDKKWTQEAIFNILDNAVKYSKEKGRIEIYVSEQEFYTVIVIKDEGNGIDESEQALIFQRFYRSKSVHEEEGVGLGLYLAREIIMKQEGYIKVKSERNKGSEFQIFLKRR